MTCNTVFNSGSRYWRFLQCNLQCQRYTVWSDAMPECNKLFSNRQPIINHLSAFLIKYSWALNCQKLSCAVSLQHLRGKKNYIDEKHVNRRFLWFPLLRCIKKTTSRFTWHFLRCISSFNVVRCIHPINVIDLINIRIDTFTWSYLTGLPNVLKQNQHYL